jgi:hypothetical protein
VVLGALPNPARQFVAIHIRHADIHQQNGGPVGFEYLQRFGASVDGPGFGSNDIEQPAETVGGITVVIDH